jgi:hypothetical protein
MPFAINDVDHPFGEHIAKNVKQRGIEQGTVFGRLPTSEAERSAFFVRACGTRAAPCDGFSPLRKRNIKLKTGGYIGYLWNNTFNPVG